MMIIVGWQYFAMPAKKSVPQPAAIDNSVTSPAGMPSVPGETTLSSAADNSSATATAAPSEAIEKLPVFNTAATERTITVETDFYVAEFSTRGGTLDAFRLKEYKNNDGSPLNLLIDSGKTRALAIGSNGQFPLEQKIFNTKSSDLKLSQAKPTGEISFVYATDQVTAVRTYRFKQGTYAFELTDQVEGIPEYQIALGPDFGIYAKSEKSSDSHVGPVVLEGAKRREVSDRKIKKSPSYTENVKWIANEDKYFFSAIVPRQPMLRADAWMDNEMRNVALASRPGTMSFLIYAGPKIIEDLKHYDMGLEHIVDYGFFSIIARPIFWMLKRLYAVIGNYGWAIVMLTIIIRIPFIPLVNKSQKSMRKMQQIQPKVQQLKEQFKKQPEVMNQKMMELYKKYNVNPVGGCLPLLLQIPVFFALYKVLLISIELRGAPFMLWITDLSLKDPYYVMPLVLGASMFLQQKMTPTSMDPKQQKILMLMPVVFTFLFLNFPAGLVVYWLVNNTLSIIQQFFVNKHIQNEPALD